MTARAYEADAILRHASDVATEELDRQTVRTGRFGDTIVRVAVADVGPVAAALVASDVLNAQTDFDAVLSAGISGAFVGSGLGVGDLVVATAVHHADLGAEIDGAFVPGQALEWPFGSFTCDASLVDAWSSNGDAIAGAILTTTRQSTSPERIAELQTIWPEALAEAMEGVGVASAAARFGLPMTEVRAISNMVGPRSDYPWDKPLALDALAKAFTAIG